MRIDNISTGPFSVIPTASYASTASFAPGAPNRVTGTWTLNPGNNTRTFTLATGSVYQAWVFGNVPFGIALWNAIVNTENSNLPVLGTQYAWYYPSTVENPPRLILTSIPSQIVGTNGARLSGSVYSGNSTTYSFGIRNDGIVDYTVQWGYIKLD